MTSDPQPPERLWKYRKWNDHTRRLIVEGEVYFAKSDELNDPFEFYWREQFPTDPEEIDLFVREFCAKHSPGDSIEQRRINYASIKACVMDFAGQNSSGVVPQLAVFKHGVLCLSEINYNILMWGHYTNNHAGLCVGVRPDRMEAHRILRVEYTDTIPIIDAWSYIRDNPEAFVTAGRSKSPHWSYEKEWRTVHYAGAHKYPGCVDQVIIGAMATDTTRSEVLEAVTAAEHPIKVFEAKKNPSRYKLDIVPLDGDDPTAKSGRRRRR